MKTPAIRLLTLPAAVLAAALVPASPTRAQGIEFGYKDRIFEQKYQVPDNLTGEETFALLFVQQLKNLMGADARVMNAAGGMCLTLWLDQFPKPELTPAQAAIEKFPIKLKLQDVTNAPPSPGDLCRIQFNLFAEAFSDSASTDRQLKRLASTMRSRFADVWMSSAEIADPRIRAGGERVGAIFVRLARLFVRGLAGPLVPDNQDRFASENSLRPELLAFKTDTDRARVEADITAYEATLTAAEEAALQSLKGQRDAQANAQAVERRAQDERRRVEEEVRRSDERQQREREARALQERRREAEIDSLKSKLDQLDNRVRTLRNRMTFDRDVAPLQAQLDAALAERTQVEAAIAQARGTAVSDASQPPGASQPSAPTAVPSDASGPQATTQDTIEAVRAEARSRQEQQARQDEAARQVRQERLKAEEEARLAERRRKEEKELAEFEQMRRDEVVRRLTYQQEQLDSKIRTLRNRLTFDRDVAPLQGQLNAALAERARIDRGIAEARGLVAPDAPQANAPQANAPQVSAPPVQQAALSPPADPQRSQETERQRQEAIRQDAARQEAARQEAARQAEMSRLEGRLAEIDRTIARLQQRMAGQQGAILRNPLNPQSALSGIAGMGQVQAELDQAKAQRFETASALARLRKAAAQAANGTSGSGSPTGVAPVGTDCRQGAVCRVIEVTLFCRAPQQMAAILSQRPGPARKQVLSAFTASGDCRQVAAGETLAWTDAMATVQPKGEPPAELVPGTLTDGTAGFMLKDGVIARTGVAAR